METMHTTTILGASTVLKFTLRRARALHRTPTRTRIIKKTGTQGTYLADETSQAGTLVTKTTLLGGLNRIQVLTIQ
jgi:hypothetical protein